MFKHSAALKIPRVQTRQIRNLVNVSLVHKPVEEDPLKSDAALVQIRLYTERR